MNRERVQMLRDMIAGIPDEQLDLEMAFQNGTSFNPPTPCGAIACIAGWAWLYPPFINAGIRDNNFGAISGSKRFFGLDFEPFKPRSHREAGTDKQIAIRRLDKLLGTQP